MVWRRSGSFLMVFFLGVLSLATAHVYALDIEFIADQQLTKLQSDFARLPIPSTNTVERALVNRSWICELYGVRTRLQVERNVSLYSFSRTNRVLNNRGSYPIDRYRMGSEGIIGRSSILEDVVRVSVDGNTLISELSAPAPERAEPGSPNLRSVISPLRQAIAYAVCK